MGNVMGVGGSAAKRRGSRVARVPVAAHIRDGVFCIYSTSSFVLNTVTAVLSVVVRLLYEGEYASLDD
jgi:hypothetical protein